GMRGVGHAVRDPLTGETRPWLAGVEDCLVAAAQVLLNDIEFARRLHRCGCGRFWFTVGGGAPRRYCPGHRPADTAEGRRMYDERRRIKEALLDAGCEVSEEVLSAIHERYPKLV